MSALDLRKDRPHYVYRYFSAADQCLYIGCTFDLGARHRQHQAKEWFPLAVRREHTAYPDRWTALVAEKTAIIVCRPIHNRTHNYWTLEPGIARDLHQIISERPANSSELIAEIESRAFEDMKAKQRVRDEYVGAFVQEKYDQFRRMGVTHLGAMRRARKSVY